MLKLHEVVKRFDGNAGDDVLALNHVCLEIEADSFVVVIGTNGSGKSTLLNAIAGSVAVDGGAISLMPLVAAIRLRRAKPMRQSIAPYLYLEREN